MEQIINYINTLINHTFLLRNIASRVEVFTLQYTYYTYIIILEIFKIQIKAFFLRKLTNMN